MSDAAVQIPAVPRPLKRTASTASLPTPPRTRHRRKNGSKQRADDDTDTDEASGADSGCELPDLTGPFKKRKTEMSKEATEDEDAFWLGAPADRTRSKTVLASAASAASSLHSPPQSPVKATTVRRSQRTQSKKAIGVPPISPPPSKHKRAVTPERKALVVTPPPKINLAVTPSPPSTPVKQSRPIRDSPDNPFLDSPLEPGFLLNFERDTSPTPSRPCKEPPKMVYVYRGKRQEFPNPYYNYHKERAHSPLATSRLPIEHRDYSPDFRLLPRVLFPVKKTRSVTRKQQQEQQAPTEEVPLPTTPKAKPKNLARLSLSPVDGQSDDEEDAVLGKGPIPLQFGVPDRLMPLKDRAPPAADKGTSRTRAPASKTKTTTAPTSKKGSAKAPSKGRAKAGEKPALAAPFELKTKPKPWK